jgi:hypothetical protein
MQQPDLGCCWRSFVVMTGRESAEETDRHVVVQSTLSQPMNDGTYEQYVCPSSHDFAVL